MKSIRQATVGDVEVICDALRNLKTESPYFDGYPEDAEYVHQTWPGLLNTPGTIALMEQDCKGFILGFVGGNWYSPVIECNEALLYVFPEHRGGRTAIALIRGLEQEARPYGAVCINAGSSLGINDPGVGRLYERLGYTKRGHGYRKQLNV